MTPEDKQEYLEDLFRSVAAEDNEAQRVIQEMGFIAQALGKYRTHYLNPETERATSGLYAGLDRNILTFTEGKLFVDGRTGCGGGLILATEADIKSWCNGEFDIMESLKRVSSSGNIKMEVCPVNNVFVITLTGIEDYHERWRPEVKGLEITRTIDILSDYLTTQGGVSVQEDSKRSISYKFPISKAKEVMRKTTVLYLRSMGYEETPSLKPNKTPHLKAVS